MARSTVRSSNLMLACSTPHASDWLLAPPIAGLGLALLSTQFRTALDKPADGERLARLWPADLAGKR
jgi:hypothetical protein